MRWRALVVATTVGVVLLATAGPALAKGPDQATISGPGLAHPIVLDGNGEPGSGERGSGERLGLLSDGSGLFLAMFGPTGEQSLTGTAPAGPLGPRYELTYRVPGGEPAPDTVRQDLYPLAAGGPVTYTRQGQPSFGATTHGGWYRAPAGFAGLLAALGVPGVAGVAIPGTAGPSARPDGAGDAVAGHPAPARATPWMTISAGVLAAGVAAVAVVALLRRRTVAQP